MDHRIALGNLAQGLIWAGLGAVLAPRWGPAATLAFGAAALQLGAAVLGIVGRPRTAARASALTVVLVLGLVGLWVHAALHTATRYGPDAARQGLTALGVVALALPWGLLFPTWHWRQHRRAAPDGGSSALLGLLLAAGVGVGTPAAHGALTAGPAETWPAQPDALAAAEAAFARWQGRDADLPGGAGPTAVLLTPWAAGVPGATVRGDGRDLGTALADAMSALPPPRGLPREALVLDLPRDRWTRPLPPGRAGSLSPESPQSPVTLVQQGETTATAPMPGWWLDAQPGADVRFDSLLVDAAGARPLVAGWSAAPGLTADTARQAAVDGGDMLLANLGADGRFTYVVQGPDGSAGRGYSFPRHAGTAWFLARLDRRTGLARFGRAADLTLDWLAAHQQRAGDLAWIRDPRRDDGRAWMGTTALAVLAAVDAGRLDLARPWGRALAASVGPDGAVRGELVEADATFPDQPWNPYGQGQVTLALARLAAEDADFRDAALRAGRFMDGAYAPLGVARLVVLDEHWACLAASALHDLSGEALGRGACRGYLADSARHTPTPGSPLAMPAGPAGGLAEAVVAAAFLDPDGPWRDRAVAFGQHFLDSQYRTGDAPLLPRPRRLLGGFRDQPWALDVQIDAVQHIGCALLGIEALLAEAELPGSRP